jgi:elongation factor P--(R)-beta-lysine ligase
MSHTASDDWRPMANWEVLRLRDALLRKVREFFHGRGFLEVETPILSHDVVVDRHLDPFQLTLARDPRRPHKGETLWLQTSPEFGMKRLMAAGGEAIFQVTRAFRNGERGRLHNPEFTIVEWYRRGEGYNEGMQFLSDLGEALLGRGPAERLTYAAAFQVHVGVNPHTTSVDELHRAVESQQLQSPPGLGNDRDDWLNFLLAERVEKHLGRGKPTILYDYPTSQAALARIRDDRFSVAERFELYFKGIELANGYYELLDARVLRERNRRANEQRAMDGKPALPEDSRLLSAMEVGLPPCCGCALGFDRVVMLASGAQSLDEVVAFAIERA